MFQLLVFFVVLSSMILGIYSKKLLIPIILFVNVFLDSITLISENFLVKPGYFRLLIFIIFILVYFNNLKRQKIFVFTSFSIIFFFILGFVNSSNLIVSIEGTLKLFLPFMCYSLTLFIGKLYGSDFNKILYDSLLFCGFYIITTLLFFQVYQVGESPYIAGFFYLGGYNIQITYFLGYSLILLYFLSTENDNFYKKRKIIKIILVFLIFIATILIFRRSSILVVILSLFFYYIIRQRRIIFFVIFSLLMLIPLYQLYSNVIFFQNLVEKRQKNNIQDEGRFKEFDTIFDDLNFHGYPGHILGVELFNSRDYFQNKSFVVLNNQTQLHTDFATLYHGGGIIGLSIYFSLVGFIFFKSLKKINFNDFLFPFIPLVLAFTLYSISGQYYIFSALCIVSVIFAVIRLKNLNAYK